MKRMLILAVVGICAMTTAQTTGNMVYNASFEEHSNCPQRIDALGVMKDVDAWWQPTNGSSDYFNVCGERECSVPRNKMGYQKAHSGDAYCGIYCSQADYREYLQTELRSPLLAGHQYRVAFHVSLADKSPHAVAALGAVLTVDRVADSTMGILMQRENTSFGHGEQQSIGSYMVPQVRNIADSAITNHTEWTEVADTILASGGERFLTIGNFSDFNHSMVVETRSTLAVLQGAYYYVDDVSVVCLDCHNEVVVHQPEPPAVGTTVTMWDVMFDVDSYVLLPQSYNELQRLLQLLHDNATMRIELRGHTDNTGTRSRNMELSETRATTVAEYLSTHGIDRNRIKTSGYGSSMPIDSNDTPEGRARNRRVEYRVLSY